MTNKVEAFRKFSAWLRFAGEELGDNDPDNQEKLIEFSELVANPFFKPRWTSRRWSTT